ncbi:MAG: carbon storage regulator CsrA [Nocardioides sp.]
MLVLSRRVGESIVIGDDIVVSVLEVRGDVVRLGVDAPRSVQVRRQELVVQVEETNRAAASPSKDAVAGLSRLVRDAAGGDGTGGKPPGDEAGPTP